MSLRRSTRIKKAAVKREAEAERLAAEEAAEEEKRRAEDTARSSRTSAGSKTRFQKSFSRKSGKAGLSTQVRSQARHFVGHRHGGAMAPFHASRFKSAPMRPTIEWTRSPESATGNIGQAFYEEPPSIADEELGSQDVICGQIGNMLSFHSGNQKLRDLIQDKSLEYMSATVSLRDEIAKKVVEDIREKKGRFLWKDYGVDKWREMDDEQVMRITKMALELNGTYRLAKEKRGASSCVVTNNDVLFNENSAQASSYEFHCGNQRFEALIALNLQAYVSKATTRKSTVKKVIDTIRSQKGRFLVKGAISGLWLTLGTAEIEMMVHDCFRMREIRSYEIVKLDNRYERKACFGSVVADCEVNNKDVLLADGPGDANRKTHPGNRKFHALIGKLGDEYFKDKGKSSLNIAKKVVESIHDGGGRFLELHPDSGLWLEAQDEHVMDRINNAFEWEKYKSRGGSAPNGSMTRTTNGGRNNPMKRVAAAHQFANGPKFGPGTTVTRLNDLDVICFQGELYKPHAGNEVFDMLIEANREAFVRDVWYQDQTIENVVSVIQAQGRFLRKKENSQHWYWMTEKEAVAWTRKCLTPENGKKRRKVSKQKVQDIVADRDVTDEHILCDDEEEGDSYADQPGNQRLQHLVHLLCGAYSFVGEKKRRWIVQSLISAVRTDEGFFLKHKDFRWHRVGHREAGLRIKNALCLAKVARYGDSGPALALDSSYASYGYNRTTNGSKRKATSESLPSSKRPAPVHRLMVHDASSPPNGESYGSHKNRFSEYGSPTNKLERFNEKRGRPILGWVRPTSIS